MADTPILIRPTQRSRLAAQILAELEAQRLRKERGPEVFFQDIVRWAEARFFIARGGGQPIQLLPHQKCILRMAFKRRANGHFMFRLIMYSTIKKSGKTAIGAVAGRWMAETQLTYGDIYAIGNDLKQAKERSYEQIRMSIELTPKYNRQRKMLAGQWDLRNQLTSHYLPTFSNIQAIAVDAKGEAGGKQALTIWTELWGFQYDDALKFWAEMTPVPTEPVSLRFVETYAGFDGESELLRGLYDRGLEGKQMTAHDMALAGATDEPGETYEELLYAFKETNGDPNALVPVWINEAAGQFMYWDEGEVARRMPWQLGAEGEEYYKTEAHDLPPKQFERLHLNRWVGAESEFVPIEKWDECYDPEIPGLIPGDKTPIVLSLDAATTGDCFGITALARHAQATDEVDVRAYKLWNPKEEGGRIDYEGPEDFVRLICGGGCLNGHGRSKPNKDCEFCQAGQFDVAAHNVVQICYDPYQLEDMMNRLRKEAVAWCEPFPQNQPRLKADRELYNLIIHKRIHHRENPKAPGHLRQHVLNANAKLQKDQDSTMRIVKKAESRKIDLCVSMSMGADRVLYLNL